jgi:hypothetical protein
VLGFEDTLGHVCILTGLTGPYLQDHPGHMSIATVQTVPCMVMQTVPEIQVTRVVMASSTLAQTTPTRHTIGQNVTNMASTPCDAHPPVCMVLNTRLQDAGHDTSSAHESSPEGKAAESCCRWQELHVLKL